jgi:hypothetical protein
MSLDGIDLVKDIAREHDISCDLVRNGSFCSAFKASHLEALKKEQEFLMKHLSYENHIVEAHDSRLEVDSPLYHPEYPPTRQAENPARKASISSSSIAWSESISVESYRVLFQVSGFGFLKIKSSFRCQTQ